MQTMLDKLWMEDQLLDVLLYLVGI